MNSKSEPRKLRTSRDDKIGLVFTLFVGILYLAFLAGLLYVACLIAKAVFFK